jgi:putative oxidoreductase
MKISVLIGRILFSLIFLMSGLMGHFKPETAQYAASAGVPMASVLVPLSGIIAILGALSIILGFKAKMGAWLIILFLIPVTFMMHKFWGITDPMQMQMQMSLFMKNIALIGGALIISYFGAGPLSIDNKGGAN